MWWRGESGRLSVCCIFKNLPDRSVNVMFKLLVVARFATKPAHVATKVGGMWGECPDNEVNTSDTTRRDVAGWAVMTGQEQSFSVPRGLGPAEWILLNFILVRVWGNAILCQVLSPVQWLIVNLIWRVFCCQLQRVFHIYKHNKSTVIRSKYRLHFIIFVEERRGILRL